MISPRAAAAARKRAKPQAAPTAGSLGPKSHSIYEVSRYRSARPFSLPILEDFSGGFIAANHADRREWPVDIGTSKSSVSMATTADRRGHGAPSMYHRITAIFSGCSDHLTALLDLMSCCRDTTGDRATSGITTRRRRRWQSIRRGRLDHGPSAAGLSIRRWVLLPGRC